MAVAQTPGTQKIGAAQEEFAQRAKAQRIQLEGTFRPFTVINFNPVPLHLEGELRRFSIPSPDDTRLPADVCRVEMEWEGKLRYGHALTIREPWVYGRMSNAIQAGGPGEVVPVREVAYFLPVGIAYSFLEHFSPIFVTGHDRAVAAPPKDARKIFGVMAFEGDLHSIESSRLQESNRKIKVPLCRIITIGKTNQRIYETVECDIDEYKQKMFAGQLRFADTVISRAQQKFSKGEGPDGAGDISEADRVWYRWAISYGYAEGPREGEKSWLNELITLDRRPGQHTVGPVRRKCQSCRKPEPEPGTPFCPNCNSPIDTFTTFMAGFPVGEAWLMALDGEERETALAELERRKIGFVRTAAETPKVKGETEEKAAHPARSASGKFVKKNTADEIPAADTTVLPGEE